MMKNLAGFIFFCAMIGSLEAAGPKSPDLILNLNMGHDKSEALISKVRRFLTNLKIKDPFRQKFEKSITVVKSDIQNYLKPSALEMVSDLGKTIQMDIANAETKVEIQGLIYDVKAIGTDFKSIDPSHKNVNISSDFSISSLEISSEKVILSLKINELPEVKIEVLNPVIKASQAELINFFADLNLSENNDIFKVKIAQTNFENLSSLIKNDGISIDFAGIKVPNVVFKVGSKSLSFDSKKIEGIILNRKHDIKNILLAQFAGMLESGAIQKVFEGHQPQFKKEYPLPTTPLETFLKIESIEGSGENLLLIGSGEFCPKILFQKLGSACKDAPKSLPAPSRLTEQDTTEAVEVIQDLMDDSGANIMFSISEDYVNKVLLATYDVGLLDAAMKKAEVRLGPNKMFMRMNKQGKSTGTVYLDVIYSPSKTEAFVLGSKDVRFSLAMDVGLRIEKVNNIPHFIVYITDIDTSSDFLLNGKPEIGAISNIHSLRMKKQVMEAVRKSVVGLRNYDLLNYGYPEYGGLQLEKTKFVSDGNGRMNAYLKFGNED